MSVKTGQAMSISFCVKASAGTPVDADSLPTAKLRKNGTDQGTSVTVAKVSGASGGDGQYVASWTQPTTAVGDLFELLADYTVSSTDYGWQVVWGDVGDTKFVGNLNDIAATAIVSGGAITTSGGNASANMVIATATVTLNATQGSYAPAKAGDAMALTSGERTTLSGVIWNSLTSGMTTAGSIGLKLANWVIGTTQTADVAAVKTQTDKMQFDGGNNLYVDVNALSGSGVAVDGDGNQVVSLSANGLIAAAGAVWTDSTHTIDTKTPQQALRIIAALVGGKVSGAGTTTEVFVGLDGSTTRATSTVDSSGNRTAVVYA